MFVSKSLRSRITHFLIACLLLGLVPWPALASQARQDTYPPPASEQAVTPTFPALEPTPTLATYPSFADPDFATAAPAPIGGEGIEQVFPTIPSDNTGVSQQLSPEDSSRGLVFLWLSFVATSLVFLIAVVGSILLFTRRNEN